MISKLLIANRGEIAVRVIRACKELNIRTVAVYSEADANSMHAQIADEAICIGRAPSADSYLRIDRLVSACEVADVDAVHPLIPRRLPAPQELARLVETADPLARGRDPAPLGPGPKAVDDSTVARIELEALRATRALCAPRGLQLSPAGATPARGDP